MGRTMLEKVIASLGGVGQIEQPPRFEGRLLVMVIAPK
jgi:translation initiation factor IF-3